MPSPVSQIADLWSQSCPTSPRVRRRGLLVPVHADTRGLTGLVAGSKQEERGRLRAADEPADAGSNDTGTNGPCFRSDVHAWKLLSLAFASSRSRRHFYLLMQGRPPPLQQKACLMCSHRKSALPPSLPVNDGIGPSARMAPSLCVPSRPAPTVLLPRC